MCQDSGLKFASWIFFGIQFLLECYFTLYFVVCIYFVFKNVYFEENFGISEFELFILQISFIAKLISYSFAGWK